MNLSDIYWELPAVLRPIIEEYIAFWRSVHYRSYCRCVTELESLALGAETMRPWEYERFLKPKHFSTQMLNVIWMLEDVYRCTEWQTRARCRKAGVPYRKSINRAFLNIPFKPWPGPPPAFCRRFPLRPYEALRQDYIRYP